MGAFGGLRREVVNVPPHGFELPAEAVYQVAVLIDQEKLVHQPGNDVPAERQPRQPVALLLAFEPGALEEGLVSQYLRRERGLTEQSLRREQGASFRRDRVCTGVQLVWPKG
jgi:hypothetical protein